MPPTQPATSPDDDVLFTKLSFHGDGIADKKLLPIYEWTPGGHGIDVAWNRNGIYVMKKPGVLHWIDDRVPSNRMLEGIRPAFDGRYIWTTNLTANNLATNLLVIDPLKESVDQVPLGLPPSSELQVAALSPGRAMVIGYFGQTYAAVVDLQPQGKPKVKIVHEFRQVPEEMTSSGAMLN